MDEQDATLDALPF